MTAKEILNDYLNEEEMAKVLGISVPTLRNRISAAHDHPPFSGIGKNRRFPIDAFKKWDKDRLVHQKNKRR